MVVRSFKLRRCSEAGSIFPILVVLAMLDGCVFPDFDLDSPSCPCWQGWVCDEEKQSCVAAPSDSDATPTLGHVGDAAKGARDVSPAQDGGGDAGESDVPNVLTVDAGSAADGTRTDAGSSEERDLDSGAQTMDAQAPGTGAGDLDAGAEEAGDSDAGAEQADAGAADTGVSPPNQEPSGEPGGEPSGEPGAEPCAGSCEITVYSAPTRDISLPKGCWAPGEFMPVTIHIPVIAKDWLWVKDHPDYGGSDREFWDHTGITTPGAVYRGGEREPGGLHAPTTAGSFRITWHPNDASDTDVRSTLPFVVSRTCP
jgi:hypothetical protein